MAWFGYEKVIEGKLPGEAIAHKRGCWWVCCGGMDTGRAECKCHSGSQQGQWVDHGVRRACRLGRNGLLGPKEGVGGGRSQSGLGRLNSLWAQERGEVLRTQKIKTDLGPFEAFRPLEKAQRRITLLSYMGRRLRFRQRPGGGGVDELKIKPCWKLIGCENRKSGSLGRINEKYWVLQGVGSGERWDERKNLQISLRGGDIRRGYC